MANDLARRLAEFQDNPNVGAFKRVIREGETDQTDAAYYRVNSLPNLTILDAYPFPLYLSTHDGGRASGAFQAIPSTWGDFIRDCGERDFSIPSQELFAIWAINKRGALQAVVEGRLAEAIALCRLEWTSLPGAAENSGRYTLERAARVYASYGGTLAPSSPTQPEEPSEQTAAPIDERPWPQPSIVGTNGPEIIMPATGQPSTIDAIAGIASLINPAAGGIIGLAGKLLEAFAPKVVAKLNGQIGKTTDIATEATALVSQAQILTGKPDPFDAVAAVRADPAVLAKIEESTEQRMDAMVKAADKTIGYDQAKWTAENVGKQSVSSIAIAEHNAGLWDMTETLVKAAVAIAVGGSGMLLLAIVYQSIWKTIDPVLLALAGPLLALTFGAIGIVLAYRFDGTKDASAQTTAILNATKKE